MKEEAIIFTSLFVVLLSSGLYALDDMHDYSLENIDYNLSLYGHLSLKGDEDSYTNGLVSRLLVSEGESNYQKLSSIKTSSFVKASLMKSNASILLVWGDLAGPRNLEYELSFLVSRYNDHAFYAESPSFYEQETANKGYLEFEGKIDSDGRLRSVSSALRSKGEIESIFNAMNWITEKYEFSDMIMASPATEAYNKKAISLEEAVALFISISRNMGIPSRFVYGIANDNDSTMNPHYWAECLTQGYGWIPVDLWNSQLGYLDNSHIKLFDSEYISNKLVYHNAINRNTEISSFPPDHTIRSSAGEKGVTAPLISVNVSYLVDDMKPGSFNIVWVKLTNDKDFPFVQRFSFPENKRLEVRGDNDRLVFLPPGSSKEEKFIIRNDVPESLVEDGPYSLIIEESPISRDCIFRDNIKVSLPISRDGSFLSMDKAEELLSKEVNLIENEIEDDNIKDILKDNFSQKEIDSIVKDYHDTKDKLKLKKYSTWDKDKNKTVIHIELTPEYELENVSLIESIPKCLMERVDEIVASSCNYSVLKADPLIVWKFDELNEPMKISYDVLQKIRSTECEDESLTLAVASKISKRLIGDKDQDGVNFKIIFFIVAAVAVIGSFIGYSAMNKGAQYR